MADFFDCSNSGIDFKTFFPNLIKKHQTLAGLVFGGINVSLYTTGTLISPYVCTANDTLDSLLKRCIELPECCDDAPAIRLYVVTPTSCPDTLAPCGSNFELIFEGVKWCFAEIQNVGLALVIIDTKGYCDKRQ